MFSTLSVRPSVARASVATRAHSEKVATMQRHAKDSGSPEVQITLLSQRIEQLTSHLQQHKKDYSTQRGLNMIISKRAGLLKYLEKTDRAAHKKVCAENGIRIKSVVADL